MSFRTRLVATSASLALVCGVPAVVGLSPAAAAGLDPSQVAYSVLTGTSDGANLIRLPGGQQSLLAVPARTDGSIAVDAANSRGWMPHNADAHGTTDYQQLVPIAFDSGTVGAPISVPCLHPQQVTASADDTQLAVFCAAEQQIKILRTSDWSVVSSAAEPNTVLEFAWAPDGSRVFVADDTGVFSLYNGALSANVTEIVRPGDPQPEVRVLADGRAVIVRGVGGADGLLKLQFVACGAANCTSAGETDVAAGVGKALPYVSENSDNFAVDAAGQTFYVWGGGSHIYQVSASGVLLKTLHADPARDGSAAYLTLDPTGSKLIVNWPSGSGVEDVGLLDIATDTFSVVGTTENLNSERPATTLPPAAPLADYTWEGGVAGQPITFTASAVTAPGVPVLHYHWAWGDGTPDTTTSDPTTTHTYAASSGMIPYRPRLTVTDALGQAGPGSGWWDGTRWVTRGSTTAVIWHDVYVSDNLQLVNRFAGLLPGQPAPHFHPGDLVGLSAIIGPWSAFGGKAPQLQFTVDGTDYGSPQDTTVWGTQGYIASVGNIPVPGIGQHVFGVRYAGDSTVTPTLPPVVGNSFDVYVDPWPSGVRASTATAEVASGTQVLVHAAISAPCTDGRYLGVVDGNVAITSYPDAGASSHDIGLPAPTDGTHRVTVIWQPDPGSQCATSVSTPLTVKVGTSATRAALSGPKYARPGIVALSSVVTSSGGAPTSGTVTIRQGGTVLASAALGAGGKNAIPVPLRGLGRHTLTATFSHVGVGWTGSTSAPLIVSIGNPPVAPSSTSVRAISHGLAVGCRLPAGPLTGLVVTATPLDPSIAKPVTRAVAAACPAAIGGLVNGEAYRVVVAARNVYGTGPVSAARVGVAGLARGVSLFVVRPVSYGQPSTAFGYTVNSSVPIGARAVRLVQLAAVTSNAGGRFQYSRVFAHTTSLRAQLTLGGVVYTAGATAQVAFVIAHATATTHLGRLTVTGQLRPGTPAGTESRATLAVYAATATRAVGSPIGYAQLTVTRAGATVTAFAFTRLTGVLGADTHVYLRVSATRYNAGTGLLLPVAAV